MRKRIVAIFLSIATLTSCSKHDTGFTLYGTVPDGGDDTIFITGLDSRYDRVDTVIMKNGTFTFQCEADTIIPLLLLFRDGRQDAVFADKNLTANYSIDPTGMAMVDAGLCNLQLSEYLKAAANDYTDAQIIDRIDSFIQKNPVSELSPYLIYRFCLCRSGIDKNRIMAITDRMGGLMHDNPLIADIRTEFGKASRTTYQFSDNNLADTSFCKVTDITDLHEQSLNMLVCIWASWDSISRAANREMDSLAVEYGKKKITFAGLSIDTDRNRWKSAVLADSLDTEQLIDWQGWSSSVMVQMEIEHLPYYILLGPSGRIMEKDYSVDRMRRLIENMEDKKKSDLRKKQSKTAAKTASKSSSGIGNKLDKPDKGRIIKAENH